MDHPKEITCPLQYGRLFGFSRGVGGGGFEGGMGDFQREKNILKYFDGRPRE